MSNAIPVLRDELQTTSESIPALEAAVTVAQERLRFATEKEAQIRLLLTMLEAEANENVYSVVAAPPALLPTKPRTPEPGVRVATKADRMDQEATALLTMRGTVHRKEILAHLIEKEIMGSEKDPLAHLAAFLSDRKERYESDGKGNFKLRRPISKHPANPHEIPQGPPTVFETGELNALSVVPSEPVFHGSGPGSISDADPESDVPDLADDQGQGDSDYEPAQVRSPESVVDDH